MSSKVTRRPSELALPSKGQECEGQGVAELCKLLGPHRHKDNSTPQSGECIFFKNKK